MFTTITVNIRCSKLLEQVVTCFSQVTGLFHRRGGGVLSRRVRARGPKLQLRRAKKKSRSSRAASLARSPRRHPAHGGRSAARRSAAVFDRRPLFVLRSEYSRRMRASEIVRRTWRKAQRDVEVAIDESFLSEFLARRANRQNFGVSGRIASRSTRLPATATTRPARATLAPTGTSPASAACRAASKAAVRIRA